MTAVSVLHWPSLSTGVQEKSANQDLPRQPVSRALAGSLVAHALALTLLPPLAAWRVETPVLPQTLNVSISKIAGKSSLASPATVAQPQRPAAAASKPERHVPAPTLSAAPAVMAVAAPVATSERVPTATAIEPRPAVASTPEPVAAVAQSQPVTADNTVPVVAASIRLGEISRQPPVYPLSAKRRGIEGTVALKIEVLPNGEPGRVEIARSSGDSSLDESARDAARLWRFTPAQQGGKAMIGWARVEHRFVLPPAE